MVSNKSCLAIRDSTNYQTNNNSFVDRTTNFGLFCEKDKRTNSRRTREMRKSFIQSSEKNNPYTPHKKAQPVNQAVKSSAKKSDGSSSYITYHGPPAKRSHTPAMYRASKPKVMSKNESCANFSSVKKVPQKAAVQVASTESLRLKLYKCSRGVTLKHLNNLCTRPNNNIREIMRLFCLILNCLRKQEFQINPLLFDDWYSLCNYVNKNNCTILAEVIAVSNKIERGIYEKYEFDSI